jgi:hypothetical protein
MNTMTAPEKPTAAEQRAEDRRKRQAKALRDNLKRRKASAPAKDDAEPAPED